MKSTLLSTIVLTATIYCLQAQTTPTRVHLSATLTDPHGKVLSAPSVSAKDGNKATVSITQDKFISKEYVLPTGVVLTFTPKIEGKTITYSGQITLRETDSSVEGNDASLLAFKTTEFLFSGAATSGKPVRLTLPDKSVVILHFSLQDPDGELASKG